MCIAYLFNLYINRSCYFVCAVYLAEMAYFYLLLFHIITTPPYKWGCQLLLKLFITNFYAYFIFVESLRYKVLIFCLCWSFGRNGFFIFTNLPYNSNSAIQGGCQLLLKISITDFYLLNICYIFTLQVLDTLFVQVIWRK